MNKSIFFKQSKPIIAPILGISILVLMSFLTYEGEAQSGQIVLMIFMSIVLLGYSISYEIKESFDNKKHFKLFGLTLFKQKLEYVFPDYISVFSALFKRDTEWGPVAAMGRGTKEGNYVIRFFKGNRKFTICKTNSLELANTKAAELGVLLNVEVKLKN